VVAFLFANFTIFCPPLILQSDNKKEFVYSVIVEIVQLWTAFQIINGRPRCPASQGKIERANGILEAKLGKKLYGQNDCCNGCKIKNILEYKIGEDLKIIPKIDRFVLGAKMVFLNKLYCAGEMEPLSIKKHPELEHIPSHYVSVREAARSQNTGMLAGTMCKCKDNCNTVAKKSNVGCGRKCHSRNICNDKI
ncbi:42897_t:CDS:2, partial [Gigaspora margarita]